MLVGLKVGVIDVVGVKVGVGVGTKFWVRVVVGVGVKVGVGLGTIVTLISQEGAGV